MSAVLVCCVALLTVASLMLVVRISWGPTMLDRVVALDVLVAVVICGLAVEAAVNRHTTTLPVLVVLSLLGFVGSVSVARFTQGSDDVEEERA
ncbi:monovalent cation/H+ antiporter complex subunit F [Nocardioides sp. TF02-7]|uniref:monovalent cation/H+ antiporter complex subunit F n=1 Tax=Nocardioides sp. TF02-7 TaxID=2917724 RepID=UPI001F064226|nr:monovalent cation/H+ antiporter complex subunit F [Nocardioides sp. TF02-7]UMG92758.1 monovalent cation/H+ antiporter complex subunit F [Nocardioides sp. TF02-7]